MSAKKFITYQEAITLNDIVSLGKPSPKESKIRSIREVLGPNILPPHKVHIPEKKKQMTYDEARIVLYKIYHHQLKGRKAEFTKDQSLIIKNALKYFVNDESSIYDLNKGLYVFGDYGRGKTLMNKCLFTLCKYIERDNIQSLYKFYEYEQLVHDAKDTGSSTFIRKLGKNVFIDDIGYQGQSMINIYGNKEDFVTSIIKVRHSRFMRGGHKTYFTSNLTIDQIKEYHSEGTSGRIEEMCNVIFFDGKSLRK